MSKSSSRARVIAGSLTGFIVGVAVATAANMFSVEMWVVFLGAGLLAGAASLTLGDGPLQRRTEGVSPAQRFAAVLTLLGYIAGSVYAAQNWSVIAATLTTAILAAVAVILTLPALRRTVTIDDALARVVVPFLPARGSLRLAVPMLLFGVALLLFGVVVLRGGNLLGGATVLLLGVAAMLFGVADLVGGSLLRGVAALLMGVAVLLSGVSLVGRDDLLFGVATMLLGVPFLLFGVVVLAGLNLLGGATVLLFGVGILLFGVAALLFGVAILVRGNLLAGATVLLCGAVILLLGLADLFDWGTVRSKLTRVGDWFLRPAAGKPIMKADRDGAPQ